MTRTLAITLLCSALSAAQSGLAPPRLGCLVAGTGSLRPLLGLPGNFILGEVAASEVRSAACSERFTLLKREDALELLDEEMRLIRRWSAPGGAALFALSAEGLPAVAYFPDSSQWFRVTQREFRKLELDGLETDVEVLALAQPETDRLAAVVQKRGRLWLMKLSLATRQIGEERELAGATAPVLLRPDGALLFAAPGGLIVQTPDGAERGVPLPGSPAGLEQMSGGWIHVQLAEGKGRLALRLLDDAEELYQLPEAPR